MVLSVNILKILLLAALVVVLLFGGHYFLFYSAVSFLGLTKPVSQAVLLGILAFLSVGFILASILAHQREGLITRSLYVFFASWLGIYYYLFIGSACLWLIKLLGRAAGFNWSAKLSSNAFMAMVWLAVLLFAIGVVNAFSPRLKKITVKISNLPAVWRGKTIIQLSDIHLGHVHRSGFLERVVKRVNRLDHELVLITGDLFDGLDGSLEEFVKPLNDLKTLQGIFFVSGNHEVYLGLQRSLKVVKETKIKILDNQAVVINGLQLAGLPYEEFKLPTKKSRPAGAGEDILDSLVNFQPGLPTVLLKHLPTKLKNLGRTGVNLVLCGHTHVGQLWPLGLITYLVFRSYHFGLTVKDNFTVYTSSGVGTWGPPSRLGNRPEIVAITLQ
ncbi:MAG: metallophosphoesterase [Candidatus Komeilibacteria bacterium]|nr:metallophosphoesterase [Candidatus Komeilibacteria bacterium]